MNRDNRADGMAGNSLHPIAAPDLDLPGVRVVLSIWLTRTGAAVVAGDRIVELLAGDVTVDISAPVSGVVAECSIAEDEPVLPGTVLGFIAPEVEVSPL
jgi:pyruvate/2-oxoglutarate dehydrogenase complex dihydrolipoamide acyltransferase (E2) component